MENRKYKFGKFIVIGWAMFSILLTWWTFKTITPQEVNLGDYSCGKATYDECIEKDIQPRAADEIKSNLVKIFEDIEKTDAIFHLPLKIVKFQIGLVDKDSQIKLEISEPKYEKTLLTKLDLNCNFAGREFSLNSDSKYLSGEYLFLNIIREGENLKKTADEIVSKFTGCNWSPKENVRVGDPIERQVDAGGTISVKKVIRPYLIFQPNRLSKFIVFLGWFVIIGGIFALVKQILQIWHKGKDYFFE